MKKQTKKTYSISIRCSDEMKEEIRVYSRAQNRTVANFVKLCIQEKIESLKKSYPHLQENLTLETKTENEPKSILEECIHEF